MLFAVLIAIAAVVKYTNSYLLPLNIVVDGLRKLDPDEAEKTLRNYLDAKGKEKAEKTIWLSLTVGFFNIVIGVFVIPGVALICLLHNIGYWPANLFGLALTAVYYWGLNCSKYVKGDQEVEIKLGDEFFQSYISSMARAPKLPTHLMWVSKSVNVLQLLFLFYLFISILQ